MTSRDNYNDLLNDLLQTACKLGHIEMVKLLLTLHEVNCKNPNNIIMHHTHKSLLKGNLDGSMRTKKAKIFGMAAFEKFGVFHMANSSVNAAIHGMTKDVSGIIINNIFKCILEEEKIKSQNQPTPSPSR